MAVQEQFDEDNSRLKLLLEQKEDLILAEEIFVILLMKLIAQQELGLKRPLKK